MRIFPSAETIVSSKWLTVAKEEIVINGSTVDYYLASRGNVAMVAGFTRDGEVLLIREYKRGCQDWVWQFPAGIVDIGTIPLDAARRELLEETGYIAESMRFFGSFYVCSPLMPDKVFLFIATGLEKVRNPRTEPTEEILSKSVSLDTAFEMMITNEIKDVTTCFGIQLLREQEF